MKGAKIMHSMVKMDFSNGQGWGWKPIPRTNFYEIELKFSNLQKTTEFIFAEHALNSPFYI